MCRLECLPKRQVVQIHEKTLFILPNTGRTLAGFNTMVLEDSALAEDFTF